MQPTADFDAGRLARSLLRRSRQGALATLMAGSGDPYCSLVNVASHPDGSPILLISRLAVHTRNLLGDPRVSLMLAVSPNKVAVLHQWTAVSPRMNITLPRCAFLRCRR